ncbi:hypothetical protein AMECASPLE_020846 [Ameca splendens]|uniref:Uncharacterized protein n=1 Tax=Ameca splendens TaxID=208324 RepID=A0ABV0XS95_9TELE
MRLYDKKHSNAGRLCINDALKLKHWRGFSLQLFGKEGALKQNVVLEWEKNSTPDDHYDSKVCVSVCTCSHINVHMHSDASSSRLNTKMSFKRSPLRRQSNENK